MRSLVLVGPGNRLDSYNPNNGKKDTGSNARDHKEALKQAFESKVYPHVAQEEICTYVNTLRDTGRSKQQEIWRITQAIEAYQECLSLAKIHPDSNVLADYDITSFGSFVKASSSDDWQSRKVLFQEVKSKFSEQVENLDKKMRLLRRFSDCAFFSMPELPEELEELLDVTTKKELFLHYGPSDNEKEMGAIPYIANNVPSKTSRFDHIHELLNYTVQMVQEIGVQDWIFRQHIVELHKLIKEDEPTAIQTITDFFPGIDPFLFRNDKNTDEIAAQINQLFHANEAALDMYLTDYILPSITTHNQSINSNSFDLVDMFSKVQGFTGTPWNRDTFHHRLTTHKATGTDGESVQVLQRESTLIQTLNREQEASVGTIIESLDLDQECRAFIDCGALFKGISNLDAARMLLKRVNQQYPEIKEIVFYLDNKKSVLRQKADETFKIIDFDKSSTSPEHRFTYYDHSHTVGADIPQYEHAQAVVTVGKSLRLRDLFQGMWRMRGVSKGQTIKLLVGSDVADALHGNVTRDSILSFTNSKQAEQLESHLLQSTPLQFKSRERRARFNSLIHQPISQIESETVASFISDKTIEPETLYEGRRVRTSKEEIIEKMTQRQQEDEFTAQIKEKALNALPSECAYPCYPEGRETEMEQEQEIEEEVQKEVQQEVFKSMNQIKRHPVGSYDRLLTYARKSTQARTIYKSLHPDLRVSKNWAQAGLFQNEFQLPCDYLLVVMSPGAEKHVVMLHEWDVQAIIKEYETYSTGGNKVPIPVGIIDAKTGDVYHVNEFADTEEIKQLATDPIFQEMAVQVKFLNGQLVYTQEELERLRIWLNGQDKSRLLDFFRDDVLKRYPEKLKVFERTPLFAMLAQDYTPLNTHKESRPSINLERQAVVADILRNLARVTGSNISIRHKSMINKRMSQHLATSIKLLIPHINELDVNVVYKDTIKNFQDAVLYLNKELQIDIPKRQGLFSISNSREELKEEMIALRNCIKSKLNEYYKKELTNGLVEKSRENSWSVSVSAMKKYLEKFDSITDDITLRIAIERFEK